ncbi:MAG: phosphatase PAP2 family protein [Flavobacteriales bacterium]
MSLIAELDKIDRSIFLALNGMNAEWLDPIMWYISQPLCSLPVYLIFIYLAYKKYGRNGVLWLLLGIGLVVLLADNIHREAFKNVFERLRPSRNPELEGLVHLVTKPHDGKLYTGGRFGFISGHASNFAGIAVFCSLFLRPKRLAIILFLAWATLICYSRIYLGVHYPGDILGGIMLGTVIGFFSHFLVNQYLVKKYTT